MDILKKDLRFLNLKKFEKELNIKINSQLLNKVEFLKILNYLIYNDYTLKIVLKKKKNNKNKVPFKFQYIKDYIYFKNYKDFENNINFIINNKNCINLDFYKIFNYYIKNGFKILIKLTKEK